MVQVWATLVALALALFVVLAARAAWQAMTAHEPRAMSARTVPVDAGAGVPVAAATLTPASVTTTPSTDDLAAPAQGVTGTTALPALPVTAAMAQAAMRADAGNAVARPFSMALASRIDRGRALECLTAAIYYEAASEPDAGQSAVAQVILNRVRHPSFPATVCGVVYQGSERAGCQFSFACDGAMARVPARTAWARAARNAAMALAGYVYAPVGLATHYHTYAVTPAWNRSLVMTDVVGAHLFHRWKGVWGTAAAFRQVYRGGEPLPGPHTPLPVPASPLVPVPSSPTAVIAAAAPLSVAPQVQPAYADSGRVIATPAPAAADRLPPAPTVLDKWKDSGKPLF